MEFKSGFVAVIGMPNVGKSTLVNALIKKKVSIVTPKPQTTRNKIMAVLNTPNRQIIFVDTPGIHKATNNLDKFMDKSINTATEDVDLILLMVDGTKVLYDQVKMLEKKYKNSRVPKFLVINKIDVADKAKIALEIDRIKDEVDVKEIVFISAKTRKNFDILLNLIDPYLTDTIHYFDETSYTDKSQKFLISEIIREKALYLIQEEIPHGIGIAIDNVEKDGNLTTINATIFCEKPSHKAIIIGKNGSMLKDIGKRAREEMEKIFKTKIYLDLWVKVKENWKNSPSVLTQIGYNDENL